MAVRNQLQTAAGACRPALRGGSVNVLPESLCGKGSHSVEDIKTANPREPSHYRAVVLAGTVYHRWWSAARGLHRKPRSHFSFFHCTDWTSDTTLNKTTTGSSPITPPSLAVCQRGMNRNAEESLLTLWNGVRRST